MKMINKIYGMGGNKRQNTPTISITQGVIWKGLLYFFFPILLGTFFQQLYSTVDAVIVGRYVGKEALAAVGGSTSAYVGMLVGFFTGIAGGAGVVIAQLYGAGDEKGCSGATHTSLMLSLIFGAVMTLLGAGLSKPAMMLIGTPPDILPLAVTYLRIYFCGMIPMIIYNMGAGILRAAGDSRSPFLVLVAGCIINIALDLLFVASLGLSVVGVSIATIISEALCAVLVMFRLTYSEESIRFRLQKLHLEMRLAKKMVTIGLPTGLQSVMYTLSNLIIQSNVNMLGTNAIAGVAAWSKIDQIFWMTIASFGVALTTFAGQNFGAGKIDRLKKGTTQCLLMATCATALLTAMFFAAGKTAIALFTDDPAVIETGVRMMRLLCPTFITYISIEVLSGAMRGAGKVAIPTLLTLFGVCILRVVWMFAVVPFNRSIVSIYVSYPITWTVTSILFWIYYMSGKWLHYGTFRRTK